MFSSSTEIRFSSDGFANLSTDNIALSIPYVKNEMNYTLLLEPVPLDTLPPEPFISNEEFDKEVNLMMNESVDTMDVEPSSVHDPTQ